MELLRPDETVLVGNLRLVNGRVEGDATTERIDELVAKALERVGDQAGNWCVLYRDLRDGRYWELSFPHSEMHGGGPPTLRHVAPPHPDQRSPQG